MEKLREAVEGGKDLLTRIHFKMGNNIPIRDEDEDKLKVLLSCADAVLSSKVPEKIIAVSKDDAWSKGCEYGHNSCHDLMRPVLAARDMRIKELEEALGKIANGLGTNNREIAKQALKREG